MKITHICHSCFLVELSHTLLLFDYFQGPLPVLDSEKALFVFSSHRHHDHYSPAVWELSESHPNVFYVLDENIPLRPAAGTTGRVFASRLCAPPTRAAPFWCRPRGCGSTMRAI